MRNMKRALSLVLTMAMLLGMFLVPTNAASTTFTDANLIENTEAVQITSGIGLFAGTTSGEFAPKATVTRAQMATIIVKMLRGSDFNADAFKGAGVNPFPDTAAFEGGWAEGYINACSQLGVVAGYGDGTFQPGKAVTTAEALTMIINALGVDPGPGEWPMTYMAKAEEMKLYGDLAAKPGTNNPLTRDQLAVIVWEGLKYSPSGSTGYSYTVGGKTFTFETLAEAIDAIGVANIGAVNEVIGEDSLASKVYELKNTTGWITGNAATGEDCTVLTLANDSTEEYGIETGLDMLGHYVTVYYKEQFKNEEDPGVAYTIVDESTVVTVKEAISTAKKYKEAFGKSIEIAADGFTFDDSYGVSDGVSIAGYTAGSAAPKGTYIIADGAIVTYIEPTAVYASYISSINTAVGNEKVFLSGTGVPNAEGDDRVVEYAGMKSGDFVTYVMVDDIYVLAPVEMVSGTVTKTSTVEVNGENYDAITLNGTLYPAFEPKNTVDSKNLVGRKLENNISTLQYGQSYTLYVTEDGHYIGFETVEGTLSLDDTVYLLGNLLLKEKDNYGKAAFFNKARGVDMEGKEVLIVVGKAQDVSGDGIYQEGEDAEALGSMDTVLKGFYNVKDSTDKDEKKEGIKVVEPYTSIYGPETPTYVAKTYSGEPAFTGTNWISTMEGIAAVGTGTTKYLFISGGLNDSAPLTVSVMTGSISPAIALKTSEPDDMLVTRAGAGSNIEIFVRLTEEAMLNSIYVYATQEQIDNAARTADGYAYTVYNIKDGKTSDIIIGEDQPRITTPGFARLKEVEEGVYSAEYTSVNLRDPHKSSNDQDISVGIANVGMFGVTGVRMRFERMAGQVNVPVIAASGTVTTNTVGPAVNGISDTNYNNNNATSAVVVDMRDEDEIAASGVDEILNVKQLLDLQAADPGLMVVFDFAMYGHYRSHKATAMFIKKVVRDTVGMNAVIYAEDFGSDRDGDYATGFAASGPNVITGEDVKVYADRVENAGPGFYRYSVDADGNIALVPFDVRAAAKGSYGVFGMHESVESIEAIDAGTLLLTTANMSHSCSINCVDAAFEALKEVYVTADTMIYDLVEGEFITLDELKAMQRQNELSVDLFCSTGVYDSGANAQSEKDDSAEMLVITGKEPYKVSCDGNHEGWTAISEAGAITQPGNYYLTADITGVVNAYGISVDCADVTLCLNGHNIAPTSKGNGALRVNASFPGAGVELINCNPFEGGQLNGAGMQGGRALYIGKGTSATMRDAVTLTGVSATSNNAAVQVQQATFNMYGGTITGNTTSSTIGAGAVWVNADGAVFNMYGGDITGNSTTSDNGGAVRVGTGATFNMYGGTIGGNSAKTSGGGVYNDGTANLNGGTITGNTAITGGGVYNKGTVHMNGTAIQANSAKGHATGSSNQGGGVWNSGTFNMTGGSIAQNTVASGGSGGGVNNQGKFNMSGSAAITGNSGGSYGAGVRNTGKGVFTMTGGTMSGNSGGTGGAVYNDAGTGEFKMSGGTISGNTASAAGHDLYSGASTKCTLSDNAVVGEVMATGNVTITGGTYAKVVTRSSTAAGKVITITGGTIETVANDGKGDIAIAGGTVTGALSNSGSGKLTITGGTFNSDPSAYVPATHEATKSGSKWTVSEKA